MIEEVFCAPPAPVFSVLTGKSEGLIAEYAEDAEGEEQKGDSTQRHGGTKVRGKERQDIFSQRTQRTQGIKSQIPAFSVSYPYPHSYPYSYSYSTG